MLFFSPSADVVGVGIVVGSAMAVEMLFSPDVWGVSSMTEAITGVGIEGDAGVGEMEK